MGLGRAEKGGKDGGGGCCGMGIDMVNAPNDSCNGAVRFASCMVGKDGIPLAIFLVSNSNGDLGASLEKGMQRQLGVEDGVVGPKSDVASSDGVSASALGGSTVRIFTHTKEEVECNDDDISKGLMFGGGGGKCAEDVTD